jgi:hypothetical protein
VKRAFYVVANVEPYQEYQVLVLDDAVEPDAGWVRSGWVTEIRPVEAVQPAVGGPVLGIAWDRIGAR